MKPPPKSPVKSSPKSLAKTLPETTEDGLLGGRVTIIQPAGGYRAAIDPVLLAAAVPAETGERVLDVGSGSGAAALALAARVEGVRVTGLEAQADLAALARESAGKSGLAECVNFLDGNLLDPPDALTPGLFDHVMANPPYLAAGSGNPSPDEAKRAATVEGDARLADWLGFMLTMVREGGGVTVIHRHDRAEEVLAGLAKGAGGIVVFPLWPKPARQAAKRVIIRAIKGEGGETRTVEGLVLHAEDGAYTPEAEAVLRDAGPLFLAD